MKGYLRWVLRQFYLFCFLPTTFERENGELRIGERFGYMLKMLPWIIVLAVLGRF